MFQCNYFCLHKHWPLASNAVIILLKSGLTNVRLVAKSNYVNSLQLLDATLGQLIESECVSKLNIIGTTNGLSPDWRQAITWTNAGILLISPLRINVSDISIEIQTFSFQKRTWKCRPGNGGHFVSASMCKVTNWGGWLLWQFMNQISRNRYRKLRAFFWFLFFTLQCCPIVTLSFYSKYSHKTIPYLSLINGL